jgi:hypothetical protein
MKTPRDILFQKHQAAEPKLDAIRKTVAGMIKLREGRHVAVPKIRDAGTASPPIFSWREFWFSLRWHLAGMSAVWLVVVFLNLNVGHSVSLASALPREKIPSAQMILASLRENRRELLEMIQPSGSRDARPSKLFPLQPRSERPDEILTA